MRTQTGTLQGNDEGKGRGGEDASSSVVMLRV